MSDPIAKIKKKLQDEIDQLDHELNVDLPKEIVNARIAQLKKRMGDLGMLNLTNIPTDRSGFGSKIVVIDTQKDVRVEYRLVSSEEADVEKGFISTTSPIGRALLNRKVGDEVRVATPAGSKEFEVVELLTIHQLE